MVSEVAPGIFQINQKKKSRFAPFSVNVYVIAGQNGLVFDGGLGGQKAGKDLVRQIRDIEKTMRARGNACQITGVLPSHGHWDHFSGVAYLKKHLGLTVLTSPDMFACMNSRRNYRKSFRKECEIIAMPQSWFRRQVTAMVNYLTDELFFRMFDVTCVPGPFEPVHDGQRFDVGGESWELMAMPGHCDDDVVLFSRQRGILLCGDIVLRSMNTWIGPPRSNLILYLETLENLMKLPGLTLILPSHGSPITEPYKRLRHAMDHRRKRTLEVIDLIKNEGSCGISFEKIFKTFYPSATLQEKYIARGWILLTLAYLVDKNIISTDVKGREKIFRIADPLGNQDDTKLINTAI